ncbi:hypothetical protein PsAD2_02597 [Pseudovibrio axinellae]|uniref:Uncharacterized protein n=1 Tax=Pseudovibrio axinellae TaxID=989403 RepID=A0A165Y3T0_9HYPH|nr:hypothetical protein [Pseudovibrio axinellae]KZL18413.1 hypothetical protein PsAD2_02597 [Pseudovibrio axinellae]SER82653.1 hypothetical protein SAMN05421798_1308 [Pseudovibrio axinellae]
MPIFAIPPILAGAAEAGALLAGLLAAKKAGEELRKSLSKENATSTTTTDNCEDCHNWKDYWHFTDDTTYYKILNSRAIRPNKDGKTYITDAPLSRAEVWNAVFLGYKHKAPFCKYYFHLKIRDDLYPMFEKDRSDGLNAYFYHGRIREGVQVKFLDSGLNTFELFDESAEGLEDPLWPKLDIGN